MEFVTVYVECLFLFLVCIARKDHTIVPIRCIEVFIFTGG